MNDVMYVIEFELGNTKIHWKHTNPLKLCVPYVGTRRDVKQKPNYFVLGHLQTILVSLGKTRIPRGTGIVKVALD